MSSKSEVYRRARACLEIARTLAPRGKHAILTDMPQAWLRLAEELEATNLVGDQCLTRQFGGLLDRRDAFPIMRRLFPLGVTIGEAKKIWRAEFGIARAAGLGDFYKFESDQFSDG